MGKFPTPHNIPSKQQFPSPSDIPTADKPGNVSVMKTGKGTVPQVMKTGTAPVPQEMRKPIGKPNPSKMP